jgi:hypothetical protein
MTLHQQTIEKIQSLPETLLLEVYDFVEFLHMRQNAEQWQRLLELSQSLSLAESDFGDYLKNLQNYEEKLAKGEIKWSM